LVVAEGHAGQRRLAAPDHVPAGRDEVHPVPERRHLHAAMRVAGEERRALERPAAAHCPVVALAALLRRGFRSRGEAHRGEERVEAAQDVRIDAREVETAGWAEDGTTGAQIDERPRARGTARSYEAGERSLTGRVPGARAVR